MIIPYSITGVKKNSQGDIVRFCGSFGICSLKEMIQAIKSGESHATKRYYYVINKHGKATRAHVSQTDTGRQYVKTCPDGSLDNNLDNLPTF